VVNWVNSKYLKYPKGIQRIQSLPSSRCENARETYNTAQTGVKRDIKEKKIPKRTQWKDSMKRGVAGNRGLFDGRDQNDQRKRKHGGNPKYKKGNREK